jgi:hypothetical protein
MPLLFIFILLLFSSCTFLDAKKLQAQESSREYLNKGVEVLENLEIDKTTRYIEAKEAFAQSIKLDPKNREARVFYTMLLKLIEKDRESAD